MKSRFIILCVKACLMAQLGAANVVLMGNNLTLSFDNIEASFEMLADKHCIPLLILSLSIKRSESGAFCDTSCLQVQLMYSLCRYSLDVSLCLVLR
ncbi:hypothetical protein PVAP13_6KG151730 [Panicum virgatum]|uniref:Uncharacterized protein n=1 Tax=Panicum virgatum TaxID=38727 RepID=A0A8T0RD70_PANVG|nr:hypothetical protein PVAP13_6KG151730 [Panicum virgatum]